MCLGVPGRITHLDGLVATADFFGVERALRLDLLQEPIEVGDYVLQQGGLAVHKVPAEELEETLQMFRFILENARAEELGGPPPSDEPRPF